MQEGDTKRPVAVPHDPARYQGKRLLYFLLAICIPAALLYLRLVFGLAATDRRVTAEQSHWLGRFSIGSLLLFFPVQVVSARYVQKLLTPASAVWKSALQFAAIFIFCLLFSLAGAITLEGFGMNVFLRVAGVR